MNEKNNDNQDDVFAVKIAELDANLLGAIRAIAVMSDIVTDSRATITALEKRLSSSLADSEEKLFKIVTKRADDLKFGLQKHIDFFKEDLMECYAGAQIDKGQQLAILERTMDLERGQSNLEACLRKNGLLAGSLQAFEDDVFEESSDDLSDFDE